jgi:twitching motility protein PilT
VNVPQIDRYLTTLLAQKASDLHLSAGRPPILRVHGELDPIPGAPELAAGAIEKMIGEIAPRAAVERAGDIGDMDFAYELPGQARFRVNAFRQQRGPGAVFRQIPTRIATFADLGLPTGLTRFAKLTSGLVLVTGPTGSGKSTTLAAIIDLINSERAGHILTIEDPIEFVHQDKKCLITQREIGSHSPSFAEAVRDALREDPNVILVGEMRDLETIGMALTAAETGALVFGTLHTNSASKTIDRLIDVFPESDQDLARTQLSSSLRGILCQQLVRTADGKGRVCALEIAVCTFGMANLIREGKTFQINSAIQSGKTDGMQTLEQSLAELVASGRITRDAGYAAANSKDYFASLVGMPPSP